MDSRLRGKDRAPREGQREAGTHAMIQGWIPAFAGMTEGAGRTEPRGNDAWRSDDLAGLLARTTDDVVLVDHRHTGGQRPTDRAVLLGGQPDRFDNVVR